MNQITCPYCGKQVQIDKALEGQIEARVLAAAHKEHEQDLEKAKAESAASAKKLVTAEQELTIKSLKDDAESEKEQAKKLREQLGELMKSLREEKEARANAELEAQKKVTLEIDKIREQAERSADEKQRLKLAEKDNQLEAAKKQVEEMQRKLNQGSQQLQGEILELDLEVALTSEFKDDSVSPVEKGIRGADIKHTVKSALGTECGVILWEIKRTKAWTEGWVQKLKDDLRDTKANIPVIITEVMPKEVKGDIYFHNGVWLAKPGSALVLATLLRKSLLDVGREKAITKNRGTSAEALYLFVTSHEFVQQIEAMVEVYMDMIADIAKEKAVYDRGWAKRENQAKKLLGSTANIIGSIQGQLASGAMPKIRGLDLLESGEEVKQSANSA